MPPVGHCFMRDWQAHAPRSPHQALVRLFDPAVALPYLAPALTRDQGMSPANSRLRLPTAFAILLPLALGPAPAQAAVQLPGNITIAKVDFERHVMGLFGKMGCNSGSCHGSFQGKGGFRLSLFGYDPGMDYFDVTRDSMGRRIDRTDPDGSLILLKPSGQITHGGGRRFAKGSWQYQILRQWIISGTPWQKGSGDVASLAITPP